MKSVLERFIHYMNIAYLKSNIKVRFFHSSSFSSSNNIIIYDNLLDNKKKILQDNKQKCGIYKWTNKINGKSNVGSSVNLGLRLSNYFSMSYLEKKVSIYKSKIYNALLTYGYNNFRLEILEYCDRSDIIKREQYYIDLIKPEYNILTKAESSLSFIK
jgi:excinuclease UvrABC nuclease subunit